ncbi:hypothetical protein AVEN_170458-1 [Araneus ventricosus]|uniref:Uncharacterized protein n=1 Tax=Araneus ventricosus TaxID=182803 RepID=A0A4Y2BZL1_ARAVE|nr:hypothetical protein AVEN_170458-1 [Araneus ventricosus]
MSHSSFNDAFWDRCGLVVWSQLRDRRALGSKPYSTEDPLCILPVGVAWKFGDGVPAQASSSSSDRGSKLRGPSQNSPRVASKRDVNITKPLCILACCRPNYAQRAKRLPVGLVRKYGGVCQLRCHHLTAVQNCEVRPKIALVLLQNGTLI